MVLQFSWCSNRRHMRHVNQVLIGLLGSSFFSNPKVEQGKWLVIRSLFSECRLLPGPVTLCHFPSLLPLHHAVVLVLGPSTDSKLKGETVATPAIHGESSVSPWHMAVLHLSSTTALHSSRAAVCSRSKSACWKMHVCLSLACRIGDPCLWVAPIGDDSVNKASCRSCPAESSSGSCMQCH